jgi:hypothetical protein
LDAEDVPVAGGHREGVSAGELVPRGEEVCDSEDATLAEGVRITDEVEGEGRVVCRGHVTSGSQRGEGAGDVIAKVAAGDEGTSDVGLKG